MISRAQWLPSQAAAARPQQVPQLLPLTAVTGVANGRRRRAAADAVPRGLGGGGGELARDAKRDVYLVTISRVLPDALDQTDLADVEAMSSEDVGRALLSALNGNGGGVVKKMAVFKALGRDPARAGEAPTGCDLPRSAQDPLRGRRARRVAGRRELAPPRGAPPTGDARRWVVALPCRSCSLPEQALVPSQARHPRAREDGYPLVFQPFPVVERAAVLRHSHADEARRGRQPVALVR